MGMNKRGIKVSAIILSVSMLLTACTSSVAKNNETALETKEEEVVVESTTEVIAETTMEETTEVETEAVTEETTVAETEATEAETKAETEEVSGETYEELLASAVAKEATTDIDESRLYKTQNMSFINVGMETPVAQFYVQKLDGTEDGAVMATVFDKRLSRLMDLPFDVIIEADTEELTEEDKQRVALENAKLTYTMILAFMSFGASDNATINGEPMTEEEVEEFHALVLELINDTMNAETIDQLAEAGLKITEMESIFGTDIEDGAEAETTEEVTIDSLKAEIQTQVDSYVESMTANDYVTYTKLTNVRVFTEDRKEINLDKISSLVEKYETEEAAKESEEMNQ